MCNGTSLAKNYINKTKKKTQTRPISVFTKSTHQISFIILTLFIFFAGGESDPWPGHRLLYFGKRLHKCHPGFQPPVRHDLHLLQPFHLRIITQQDSVLPVPTTPVLEERTWKRPKRRLQHPENVQSYASSHHNHCCRSARSGTEPHHSWRELRLSFYITWWWSLLFGCRYFQWTVKNDFLSEMGNYCKF